MAWIFGFPIATMIIFTARCGMAEMTITAPALQIRVRLVVSFHLFRVVMVNMGGQNIYALTAWSLSRTADREKASTSTT